MRRALLCPEPEEWQRFMLGEIPDPDATFLEEHLAGCSRCATRLDEVHAEDDLIAAMRRRRMLLSEADMPFVSTLIERVRALTSGRGDASQPVNGKVASEDATTVAGDVTPFHSSVPADEIRLLSPSEAPDEIGRIGGYRILRVLGVGGMAIVYLAEQLRPQRLVALKMIQTWSLLGPSGRARMLAEAEAIAKLKHSNIVQIYEVGEHDGMPYFTMEYVGGGNLSQRLADGLLAPREAAALLETLARALHFAHEHGFVHRDLKPANVLLDCHMPTADSRLNSRPDTLTTSLDNPKISDFGLVKQFGDGTLVQDYRTESGAVVGTPSYMPPEQAIDPAVGPTADVYALGAILYETLTGRPPFKEATPLETLVQARTHEPVPPQRLRAALPRDLQTICLKCLAKDPDRRYGAALALADDLRHFLRQEPIVARPAGIVERAWKWTQRRPTLASLVGVCLLSLVIFVVGTVIYSYRLHVREVEALAQRERADVNYQEARDAMNRMLTTMRTSKQTDLITLRRALQNEALSFFLKVADQQESDPQIRLDMATALMEAGSLQISLGRGDDAKANIEKARTRFSDLTREFPNDPRYRFGMAKSWHLLGLERQNRGLPADAIKCYDEAIPLWEAAVRADPGTVGSRWGMTQTHNSLAGIYWGAGKTDKAETHYRAADAILMDLVRVDPNNWEQQVALAQIQVNLSITCQTTNRIKEAQRYHDLAAASLEALVRADSRDYHSVHTLALLRVNWAYVQETRGEIEQALKDLAESVKSLEEMRRLELGADDARSLLVKVHGMRAVLLRGAKRYTEELEEIITVVELSVAGPQREYQRLFLAMAYARAGQHKNAMREVDVLIEPIAIAKPRDQFLHLAQVCGVALTALPKDAGLSETERTNLAETYAKRALEFLAKTRASDEAGWAGLATELASNEDFAPLWNRPDFRQLLKEQKR